MTALRVASRFAHEAVSAACSRCLLRFELRAGQWHAVEHEGSQPTCDSCAQDGDPRGFAQLLAWRRAASGPSRSSA